MSYEIWMPPMVHKSELSMVMLIHKEDMLDLETVHFHPNPEIKFMFNL